MPTTPTPDQLRQQIKLLLKDGKTLRPWRAIGFYCAAGWTGGPTLEVERSRFLVREARSTLELRAHLRDGQREEQPLIVLTDLADNQLSADILGRFFEGRVFSIEPWTLLAEEFRARRLDDRTRRNAALIQALLAHRPPEGFPAVKTGFLDEDTAWRAVFQHVFGLATDALSPRGILAWSVRGGGLRRWIADESALVDPACEWLDRRELKTSALLLKLLAVGKGAELVPIGLACQVIFHERAAGERALVQAEVRLEQLVDIGRIPARQGREWAAAAAGCLDAVAETERVRCRNRADALLRELQAQEYAHLSDALPQGYEQRLQRFAACLRGVVEGTTKDTAGLVAALREVQQHVDGRIQDHRNRKVQMATRLVRWLLEDPKAEACATLSEGCETYVKRLSFVDWARETLSGGDPVPELQQAYQALSDRATARREVFNRRFGEAVARWSGSAKQVPDLLLIEDVLRRVVAPAAEVAPVLLMVLDGMSWSVANELLASMESSQGWATIATDVNGLHVPASVLTTLPSVTEYGRTSLLCGKLTVGDANDERAGFAANAELRGVCSGNYPPVLFHRQALEKAGRQGLSAAVQQAIGNKRNKVVGVVVNAVDDYLLKSDQVALTWEVGDIQLLEALLLAAKESGRLVVLAADHGHQLERATELRPGVENAGERWQPATRTPIDGEVIVSGPRVKAFDKNGLIVPWTETIRYAAKKNGYHGGASPQELLAPCIVLALENQAEDGWKEVPREEPDWWTLVPEKAPVAPPAIEPGPLPVAAPGVKLPLFDGHGKSAPAPAPEPPRATKKAAPADWITRLTRGELFRDSMKRAGRAVPAVDEVRACLEALEAAGGQLPNRTLAERVAKPEIRMRGFVTQMQRLLNVDGYQIVGFTPDGGYVFFNKALLLRQFGIEGGA